MNRDPELLVQACGCGRSDCPSLCQIVLIRPIIVPIDGGNELGSMVQVPVEMAQGLVDVIRKFALEKGVRIR